VINGPEEYRVERLVVGGMHAGVAELAGLAGAAVV